MSMAQADQQLRDGWALHRQGRLEAAAERYRAALLSNPNHVEALHLLGVVSLQLGRAQQGVDLIGRAIALKPNHADALSNLGNGYRALGRPSDAVAAYDSAISARPGLLEAYANRGLAFLDLDRPADALASFEQALALKPDHAMSHCNRGNALQALKRPEEALASFDRAIALQPSLIEAHGNRANALLELDRASEALEVGDHVIASSPGASIGYAARGLALIALRRLHEALASLDAALRIDPRDASTQIARGHVLLDLHRAEEALAAFDSVLHLGRDAADDHLNRAHALGALGRREEALESVDRAIARDAESMNAYLFRANLFADLKRTGDAAQDYELLARRGAQFALGKFLQIKAKTADWRDRQEWLDRLVEEVKQGKRSSTPFGVLSLLDDPELHLQLAQLYATGAQPVTSLVQNAIPSTNERLRIGYFSSDLRDHPVGHLIGGAFAKHDRARFEVFAFSFGGKGDAWTDRLRANVDDFFDVTDKSTEEIVRAARAASMDVAIDLNGYTKDSRPGIFATRVAAIQISYLGYLGTMGADFMDYLIADPVLIPPEERGWYAEKIIYLPWYQANDESANAPAGAPSRAEHALPENAFVFASFNGPYKITPDVFGAWMRVLTRRPGSVLWLYAGAGETQRNLLDEAAEAGIGADRIVFAPRLDRASHLARQQLADLVLDTFPYNGGATTSNALRAGVPVLTLQGRSFASRMSASLLTALSLRELVTDDVKAYEDAAVHLATHPEVLTALRRKVSEARSADLFDADAIARHLESAYIAAVEQARAGLAPKDIVIG